MARSLVKTSISENENFKVVTADDDAIDWDKSGCTVEQYRGDHDVSKLVFLEGKEPTFFCFKNIRNQGVDAILGNIEQTTSPMIALAMKKVTDETLTGDRNTEIWHQLYVGMQDGLNGSIERPLRNDKQRLPDDTLQTFYQSGNILEECANALWAAWKAFKSSSVQTSRQKK